MGQALPRQELRVEREAKGGREVEVQLKTEQGGPEMEREHGRRLRELTRGGDLMGERGAGAGG